MENIKRTVEIAIESYIKGNNTDILFIWGPRRSGKTTILNKIAKELKTNVYNFDFSSDRDKFLPRREALDIIARDNKIVLIDEVQNHPEATVALKLLHDEYKVKIIATGSSELRQKNAKTFDSLAGRYIEEYCLPLSFDEIVEYDFDGLMAKHAQIWGMYPEIYLLKDVDEKTRINALQRIIDTYILKDIIDIYELRNQKLAKDILIKIALQLGSEVSIRELSSSLSAYASTVSNYIEVFIKNYILIPLPSFKTNKRRAVSENRKLYFYDLGVRNALIQDFRELNLRQDKGGIFENYIVSELEKRRRVTDAKVNFYFYREYGGKKIDLIIEDYKKNYTTVEIKSNKGKAQDIFPIKNKTVLINSQNYFEKILGLLV